MDKKIPKEVKDIFNKFSETDYKVYIVGGAVRDLYMDREVKDWDFTTDAPPEEILKILKGFYEQSSSKDSFGEPYYNNKFGTVGVSTSAGLIEVTTMRKEGEYKDSRHPEEVFWTNNINEDLSRRDFTVNALAMDAYQNIIDPFDGKKDLEEKIIKAVGDPKKRFTEDALRLLRAVRFASQLGFSIDEKTINALKESAKLINNISSERVRDEILKILSTDFAYEGILLLKNCGLLKEILPEIERCFGVVQEGPKHDRTYDIGEHLMLSLKYCPSPDPITRFATLIHDIGKPDTFKKDASGNVTFYGHDVIGAKIANKICERLKFSKKDNEKIVSLVRHHMFTVDEHQTDSAVRRFIKNVGFENVDDMMAVRIGDRLGGGTEKEISWRMKVFRERIDEVMKKPFSITDLKVSGKDVMETLNIPPSRKVGEILDALFKEVLEDASKNNKEYLLGRIKLVA